MKNKYLNCAISGLILGSLFSFMANAEFAINKDKSSVNFVSVKNEHIAEMHSFDDFSGTLSDAGRLQITINLLSVNTLIPIRNERMLSMLFDVTNFATAQFDANVDKKLLDMQIGESQNVTISGNLTIKDKTVPTSFDVAITRLKTGNFKATTSKPTLINASQFGLDPGISALQEIAMLKSISKTVPLSFNVLFE